MSTLFDPSWISTEAHRVHSILFDTALSLAGIVIALSLISDYFKLSFLSFVPNAGETLSRLFISLLLLYFYPEISDALASFTDSLTEKIGGFHEINNVLDQMGAKLKDFSWNLTSLKETGILILAFITFFLLYISVFIVNAGAMYVWVLLYIVSPILIILYLTPATEGATKMLFRSLIEVCCWKIMWAISAVLLWSSAMGSMSASEEVNYLTVISYNLILASALLLTPVVVSALAGQGIANVVNSAMGLSGVANMFSPTRITGKAISKGMEAPKSLTFSSVNKSSKRTPKKSKK
ncbi:MAG: hypothetical protein R3A80_04280 [Bdellovibrionota bacterium]